MAATSSSSSSQQQSRQQQQQQQKQQQQQHHDLNWNRIWNYVILPLHISYRIYLTNRMPIMDCDETFNYWEVVHFLLYNTTSDGNRYRKDGLGLGLGFQTWEYGNAYALRTYAYLLPLVFLGRMYEYLLTIGLIPSSWIAILLVNQEVQSTKVVVFLLLRSTLSVWMSYGEVSFCKSIVERADKNNPSTTSTGGKQASCTNTNNSNNDEIENEDDTSSSTGWSFTTTSSLVMIGCVTEFVLLTSTGMGHASGALLPSSTFMGYWLYAATAYIRHQHHWFVLVAVMASLTVGWPFAVIVLVPLGIGIILREYYCSESIVRLVQFIGLWIVPVTLLVQGLVFWIDYKYYGRLVSPLWNIIVYNTKAGGDELYGIEPFSYYIKNLIVNFNYVAVVGVLAFIPLLTMVVVLLPYAKQKKRTLLLVLDGCCLMLPLYLWLGVVMPRPHKEERFLYPIYPCLCLGAAVVSVVSVQTGMHYYYGYSTLSSSPSPSMIITTKQEQSKEDSGRRRSSLIVLLLIWIPAAIISSARLLALSKYYTGPLRLYSQLSEAILHNTATTVAMTKPTMMICTCGEWYRFPSSFFVPESRSLSSSATTVEEEEAVINFNFGFAQSTFDGQLPQPFTTDGSGHPSFPREGGARANIFNDMNQPEPGSYTSLDEDCDYLIELSTSLQSCTDLATTHDDKQQQQEWIPIVEVPFLDTDATTSAIHRILYIPYLHEQAVEKGTVQFTGYVLYKKKGENNVKSTDI